MDHDMMLKRHAQTRRTLSHTRLESRKWLEVLQSIYGRTHPGSSFATVIGSRALTMTPHRMGIRTISTADLLSANVCNPRSFEIEITLGQNRRRPSVSTGTMAPT